MAGVFWGGILAVLVIVLLVLIKGQDGGRDAQGWAWIDVVRFADESGSNFMVD